MKTLIMKFGGASVATPADFAKIAQIIKGRSQYFQRIVVVISAMAHKTDELIALAKEVNPHPPRRELDMLVSVGERISISLLAMALNGAGCEAISFTGSQSGIITTAQHTDARIVEVRPWRLLPPLDEGKIVIVAGFQGVSRKGEITTLGRGGSDTTAVALGVALRAEKVEFYKDVAGVYSQDPKYQPDARLFPKISYEDTLSLLSGGAKILHPRCVLLAKKNNLPLHVISFLHFSGNENEDVVRAVGTWIGGASSGSEERENYYEDDPVEMDYVHV